eukprot:2787949-Amphidinium_carterae.1
MSVRPWCVILFWPVVASDFSPGESRWPRGVFPRMHVLLISRVRHERHAVLSSNAMVGLCIHFNE